MERRKAPRKGWVISKDEVGRSVLEWKLDPRRAKRMEADPCARTYDFLNQLAVPDLTIEDEARSPGTLRSFDPYDHDAPAARRWQRHSND